MAGYLEIIFPIEVHLLDDCTELTQGSCLVRFATPATEKRVGDFQFVWSTDPSPDKHLLAIIDHQDNAFMVLHYPNPGYETHKADSLVTPDLTPLTCTHKWLVFDRNGELLPIKNGQRTSRPSSPGHPFRVKMNDARQTTSIESDGKKSILDLAGIPDQVIDIGDFTILYNKEETLLFIVDRERWALMVCLTSKMKKHVNGVVNTVSTPFKRWLIQSNHRPNTNSSMIR